MAFFRKIIKRKRVSPTEIIETTEVIKEEGTVTASTITQIKKVETEEAAEFENKSEEK